MSLLRILSKDRTGTVCSRLFEVEGLSTEISIREQDKDSIESAIALEGQDNPISFSEYDEYKLVITRKDGSEVTIDVNDFEACEFEIQDDEGSVIVNTESLFELERGLMIAHIKSESIRNKAVSALSQKK